MTFIILLQTGVEKQNRKKGREEQKGDKREERQREVKKKEEKREVRKEKRRVALLIIPLQTGVEKQNQAMNHGESVSEFNRRCARLFSVVKVI